MDGRVLAAIIVALVLLGILALMVFAWRRRIARDATVGPLALLPEPRPVPTEVFALLYVATSKHDQPLERLALPGLGYRSRITLELGPAGIVLNVPGEHETFIPAASIVGIDQTNLTIDRVVEPGGLVRLSWRATEHVTADSTFRVVEQADRARLMDAVSDLIPTGAAPAQTETQPAHTPDTVDAAPTHDDRIRTQNESES